MAWAGVCGRQAVRVWNWRWSGGLWIRPARATWRFPRASRDPQYIFFGVVVHLAARFDVVIQLHHTRFVGRQCRPQFCECPRKIVAIVVEGIVGVLAGVKTTIRLIG